MSNVAPDGPANQIAPQFISDYLPYFEKIKNKYIFQYHNKKV
jgi:hypothetical protein